MFGNIFEYNGLITKSGFNFKEWHNIFKILEDKQQEFLEHENYFRSSTYIWPSDALHNWSRIWEYPYTYYQLRTIFNNRSNTERLKVLDFGSGLTFFPFVANELGCEVYCTDIDYSLEDQYRKASNALDLPLNTITFLRIKEDKLGIADNFFDVIYCISVLEHVGEPQTTIREICRILKPGGKLILSLDLDMIGNSQIDLPSYVKLVKEINKYFSNHYPYKQIHPIDILYSNEGKYRLELSSKYLIKRIYLSIIKQILKKKYSRKLACECNVFTKRKGV